MVDRWGPGAVAVVTLLAVLWYGRFLEGQLAGLRAQVAERTQFEAALRAETQTWQAYVVSLKETMIRAGVNPPPAPTITWAPHKTIRR